MKLKLAAQSRDGRGIDICKGTESRNEEREKGIGGEEGRARGPPNKSEGNRTGAREGGRERRARRDGGSSGGECGLEKWGHVFSVKLLES